MAAYKDCHEIIFPWLFIKLSKKTKHFLADKFQLPRKALAAKVNPIVNCVQEIIILGWK
jgi:hypothetical protein